MRSAYVSYYQFNRVDLNRTNSDHDRNIFGIESTYISERAVLNTTPL